MKKLLKKMDIPLLIMMIIYSILGLVMIFSASSVSTVLRYNVEQYYFFIRQAVFVIASFIIGFLIVIRFPTKKYKYLAYFGMAGIIVALLGLLAYGKITNNARSWYDLGLFALQPSEFAKSIIIVFLAVVYNELNKQKNLKMMAYFIPILLCLIPIGLIILQPDLGTALILSGIVFFIFLGLPFIRKHYKDLIKIGGIILLIIGLFFAFIFISKFIETDKKIDSVIGKDN